MTKTEYYQLNQWELTDPVVHTDFNEDNQKIDAAINAEKAAREAADTAEAAARTAAIQAEKEAREGAIAALSGEAARCYLFEHRGDGTDTVTHTFPFPPKLFILWGMADFEGPIVLLRGQTRGTRANTSASSHFFTVAWEDNSVTLTASSSSTPLTDICNSTSQYYGVVIG